MIQGLNYFRSPIWFALVSTRGMTLDKLLLPRSSKFFALQVIWGSLVDLWKLTTQWIFNRFARFWSLKLLHNLRDRVIFPWLCPCYHYFSIFNQTLNNFMGHPVGEQEAKHTFWDTLSWKFFNFLDLRNFYNGCEVGKRIIEQPWNVRNKICRQKRQHNKQETSRMTDGKSHEFSTGAIRSFNPISILKIYTKDKLFNASRSHRRLRYLS